MYRNKYEPSAARVSYSTGDYNASQHTKLNHVWLKVYRSIADHNSQASEANVALGFDLYNCMAALVETEMIAEIVSVRVADIPYDKFSICVHEDQEEAILDIVGKWKSCKASRILGFVPMNRVDASDKTKFNLAPWFDWLQQKRAWIMSSKEIAEKKEKQDAAKKLELGLSELTRRQTIRASGLLSEFYESIPKFVSNGKAIQIKTKGRAIDTQDLAVDKFIYCVESSIYAHCTNESMCILSASNLSLTSFPAPSVLAWMSWLTELNLSNNKLSSLPPEIAELTCLKKILANNNLLMLPAEIASFSDLNTLNLCSNQIFHLPEEIGLLKNLQIFDLSLNKVTSLPASIGNLQNLQTFTFASNRISIIPHELGKLKKLTRLGLWGNPIVNVPPYVYFAGTNAVLEYVREYVEPQSTLLQLSKFLEKPFHFSDITFIVGDQRFPAHKAIVAYRSPQLAKTLTEEMKEYEVPGTYNPKAFWIVLYFMYEDMIEPSMYRDADIMSQVTSLAALFQIERLVAAMAIINKKKYQMDLLLSSFSTEAFDKMLGRAITRALTVLKSEEGSPEDISISDLPPFNPKDMLFSDVEFNADGIGYKAHKILFALSFNLFHDHHLSLRSYHLHDVNSNFRHRSEYFMKMFTSGMKESELKSIPVHMSAPAFLIVREYCYSGKIEESGSSAPSQEEARTASSDQIQSEAVELQGEHLIELLSIADSFQLPKLKEMIECVVSYSIDPDNACFLFNIAMLYRCPVVEGAVLHFIKESMMRYYKTTDGYKELDKETATKLDDRLKATK